MPEQAAKDIHGRRVHGRRHGRRLRKGLKALLEERLPRLGITLPQEGVASGADSAKLDPKAWFAHSPSDLWLEIGFGAGEHLIWQAENHSEIGFLGVEPFVNGVASLLRAAEGRGLGNIRIYQGDGRDLLDALPAACLGRVFILFSDPWPKTRHHKRRLVQRATLDRLSVVMRAGAELRLATDHGGYLCWLLEQTSDHPDFGWLARRPGDWRERPDDWPATRYETKAIEQGRQPTFLSFLRQPRNEP